MERDFPITALEVVLCAFLHGGIHPFHRYSQEQIDKAMAYLEQAGLKGLEKRQIGQLSGGERQKLLIARALASDPSILILDEPTSSIDPESRERIYAILGNLAGRITMILITHDTMAISSRVKHIACLNERLFYHGDPEIRSETLGEMYGCSVDLIAHGVPHRVLEEHDHA
jgi:zinc transport system ATP-binding protein